MEWKKLSQLVERKICYGIVQPGKGKNGNIPVIKVNNIISGLKSITELDTTTHEIASKFQRTQLFGGEIVVSVVGSVGNTAIVPSSFKGCNLVRATAMVDIKDKVLATYVMYYFKTHEAQKYIESRLNTTVQATLNIKDLEEMPIPILHSSIILRLVSILSALDSKIENNNKINANLEAQAQALFKSWFVDFTPFKDQPFVDSELGPIPQGLKICQISDISHTLETGRRQKGGAVSEGIPSVGAEHVKGMGTYDYSKTKYISPEFANKLKTGKINGYELLIYKDGGKPGYFIPNFSIFGEGYPFDLCYLNEHVFKLDFLQNKGYNIFNYFQFKTNYVMSFLNAQGGKAAIPGINKKDIECIYTFAPNNPKVVEFGNFALPLFTKILRNCVENQRLAALRDTLLPKLMSGEIKL